MGFGLGLFYSAMPAAPASQVLDPVKVAKWNANIARHKQSVDACIAGGGAPIYGCTECIVMDKCQYPVQVAQTPCVEVGK